MNWLKTLGLSVLAVFAPIKAIIISVGVLIFADLVMGIYAAMKRKESITSAGLRRTVVKMAVFQTVILTGYLLETYLIGGLVPVSKLAASVIGMTEFLSLLENAKAATGLDLFSIIKKKLGSDNDIIPNLPQNQENQSGPQ